MRELVLEMAMAMAVLYTEPTMVDEVDSEPKELAQQWWEGIKAKVDAARVEAKSHGWLPGQTNPWKVRDQYAQQGEVFYQNDRWYTDGGPMVERLIYWRERVPQGVGVRLVPEAAVDGQGKQLEFPADDQGNRVLTAAVYVRVGSMGN